MEKFYIDNHKLKPCQNGQDFSHILLTAKEYETMTLAIESLKRINRERSNAERNIKPKKDRSGYIVLGYDTNNFRIEFDEKTSSHEARRLLLETPYGLQIGYKEALTLILNDLAELSLEFGAFGCIDKRSIASKDIFESFFKADSEKFLIIFGLEAQRNGLWSVRLYANFTAIIPLDCIKQQEIKTN